MSSFRITIDKAPFLRLLKEAADVAPKRATQPILTHLHLEADPHTSELRVTSTDNEIAYSGATGCRVESQGAVCLQARDIYDVVRSLPAGDVEVWEGEKEEENGTVHLKAGRASFQLHTLGVEDFPSIEWEKSGDTPACMKAGELSGAIAKALYAVSHEETRYYLCGLLFEANPDKDTEVNVVATDGHRLAKTTLSWEGHGPLHQGRKQSAILPTRLLSSLVKILDRNPKDAVKGQILDKKAWFKVGDTRIQGLLVEGAYPDYRQAMPQSENTLYTADRAELLGAMERVSLLSPDKTGGIKMSSPEAGRLLLESSHVGRGQAKAELEMQTCPISEWIEWECGYNAHFWQDALKAIHSKRVMVGFTNHLSPCIVHPVDDEGGAILADAHVIMPMRL